MAKQVKQPDKKFVCAKALVIGGECYEAGQSIDATMIGEDRLINGMKLGSIVLADQYKPAKETESE